MSRTKRALRATVDGERRSFGTVCLATVAFLVGLLPIGAVMASPAPGRPPALVLDIERDALSLGGVWERLREQAAAEAWRPEIAAQLGRWEAVASRTDRSGRSRAENEMLRNVWLRRRFELDTTGAPGTLSCDGVVSAMVPPRTSTGRRLGTTRPLDLTPSCSRADCSGPAPTRSCSRCGVGGPGEDQGGGADHPVGADLFWGQRAPGHLRRHLDRVLRRRLFECILAVPDPEAVARGFAWSSTALVIGHVVPARGSVSGRRPR